MRTYKESAQAFRKHATQRTENNQEPQPSSTAVQQTEARCCSLARYLGQVCLCQPQNRWTKHTTPVNRLRQRILQRRKRRTRVSHHAFPRHLSRGIAASWPFFLQPKLSRKIQLCARPCSSRGESWGGGSRFTIREGDACPPFFRVFLLFKPAAGERAKLET